MARNITLDTGQTVDLDELSPEDQKFALKREKKKSITEQFKDAYNTPSFKIPFIGQEESWGDRVRGAGVNGAIGAGMGSIVPGLGTGIGAATGAAGGFLFPPHNAGDLAMSAASAPLGAGSAKLIQGLLKSPIAKTAASGALGFTESKLLEALGNLTNKGTNATGITKTPVPEKLIDYEGLLKGGMNHTKLSALLSILPPMIGQQLISNMTKNRPISKSINFAEGEGLPVSKPSDVAGMETAPVSPGMESAGQAAYAPVVDAQQQATTLAARRGQVTDRMGTLEEELKRLATHDARHDTSKARLNAQKRENLGAAGEAKLPTQDLQDSLIEQITPGKESLQIKQAALREANRNKRPLDLRQAADDAVLAQQQENTQLQADILRKKQEQALQEGNFRQSASADAANMADIDVKKSLIDQKRSKINLEKTQLKNQDTLLADGLKKARETADSWNPSDPEFSKLVLSSPNPDILLNNLFEAPPSAAMAYIKHLSQQPDGTKHVQALREGIFQYFLAKSYDPTTRAFSKAGDFFKFEGAFSPDKIRSLYGGTGAKEAEHKVTQIQGFVDDLIKSQQIENSPIGALNKGVNKTTSYALPLSIFFHPGKMLETAATAAVVKAPLFLAVSYPKLLDATLKSKKLGDVFHKWATTTDRSARSLKNWPTLAAWVEENGHPVNEEDITSNK